MRVWPLPILLSLVGCSARREQPPSQVEGQTRPAGEAGAALVLPPVILDDVEAIAARDRATAKAAKGTVQLARAWRYAGGPTLAAGRRWLAVEADFQALAIDTDDLEAIDPQSGTAFPIGDVKRLDASGNVTSFGGAPAGDAHYLLFFDVGEKTKQLALRYWGETISAAPVEVADSGPVFATPSRTVIRHFAHAKRQVILIEDHHQEGVPDTITTRLMAGQVACPRLGMVQVTPSLALAEPSVEPIISHAFYLADHTCPAPPEQLVWGGLSLPVPAAERLAIPAATLAALEGRSKDVAVVPAQEPFTQIAAHPNGKSIAIAPDKGDVRIVDLDGTERARLAGVDRSSVRALGFTPDGKHAWSVQDSGLVSVWSVETGQQTARTTLDPPPDIYAHPATTSDGRLLVIDRPWHGPERAVAWSGQLTFLSLPDLALEGSIQVIDGDEGSIKSTALAPDGKSVVVCTMSEKGSTVRVFGLPKGAVQATVKPVGVRVSACTLTADRIVLGSEAGDVQTFTRSGKRLTSKTTHGRIEALATRPDA
ncbi:MAG: WD40 repeat domain-containing protein [Myxococcota bacterium]|nr:WD40 repeat domain-containing protein [Myxococcota bacterium]